MQLIHYGNKAFRKLGLLILLMALAVDTVAQVIVEKSKDKVVISGVPYYIHIVRKGETAYSISKAYGITVEELVKNNPSAASVLRDGQALRIPPVVETATSEQQKKPVQQKDESNYFYHKLRPGDTVYSLAKSYGVAAEDIIRSNPGTDINKLPVNTEIAIPRRELTTVTKGFGTREKEYLSHKVIKGETMASIAVKYGISVRELRRENRSVVFPRVDDILRIPVNRIAEFHAADTLKAIIPKAEEETPPEEIPSETTPVKNLKGEYNVAVLLPFYLKDNSERTEIDSSQMVKGKPVYKIIARPDHWIYPSSVPFIELYQGALIAADTLRSLGLSINMYAFDTGEDTAVVEELIRSGRLDKMDLIIGPVFSKNLLRVAAYACQNKIPVVSPVPLYNNTPLSGNPCLFMAVPSIEVAQMAVARHAKKAGNANYVFIHNDETRSDTSVSEFRNLLLREIKSITGDDDLKFRELNFISRSSLPADSINRLRQTLSSGFENIVIIASEDYPVLSETIMDLHTLSRKYNIRLIGYPAVRELVNLDPKIFFDLGIELFSGYWIDYEQPDVIAFLKKWRSKYLTEPSEGSFAWMGYDIMYYFMSGMAIHGKKFLNRPSIHNPDLLETKFLFRQKSKSDGFENYHLFLLKYTNSFDIILLGSESF